MRVRRSLGLIASAFLALGSVACAALTGLSGYSDSDASLHVGPDASLLPDARAPDGASTDDGPATQNDATDDETSTELPDAAAGDGAFDDAATDDAADGSEPHDTGVSDASDAGTQDAGPDANDSGSSCGCNPAICCGASCANKHSNGAGQFFYDCSPNGTFTGTTAQEACEAVGNPGACAPKVLMCGLDGMLTVECASTSSSCTCWAYTGSGKGRLNTGLGNVCVCPGGLDNPWNN